MIIVVSVSFCTVLIICFSQNNGPTPCLLYKKTLRDILTKLVWRLCIIHTSGRRDHSSFQCERQVWQTRYLSRGNAYSTSRGLPGGLQSARQNHTNHWPRSHARILQGPRPRGAMLVFAKVGTPVFVNPSGKKHWPCWCIMLRLYYEDHVSIRP